MQHALALQAQVTVQARRVVNRVPFGLEAPA